MEKLTNYIKHSHSRSCIQCQYVILTNFENTEIIIARCSKSKRYSLIYTANYPRKENTCQGFKKKKKDDCIEYVKDSL